MTANDTTHVTLEQNVEHFFYRQIGEAVQNQKLDTSDSVRAYLVRLLAYFCAAENLFESSAHGKLLKPLAFHYGEAVQSRNREQRNQALRRLGDIALFVSGVFPHSLSRSLIDVDYYIALGGRAYLHLSDLEDQPARWAVQKEVFQELAAKFAFLVDVLGEVTENAPFAREEDLLRLHDIWSKTGSERYRKKLQNAGFNLHVHNQSSERH